MYTTGVFGDTLYEIAMACDGTGRRISKTRWVKVRGDAGIGTEIRENYHNESLDKAKVVVNMPEGLGRYGIEDAAIPYSNINSFEWYLKNHLGSTMLVYGTVASTNPNEADVGEKIAAYDYRFFGEMLELTPPATGKVTENFTGSRFARRTQRTACKSIAEPKNLGVKRNEHDDEISLDYFGARYLDPMLGMWISVDPKRQFASPYLYAGNGMNPVNENDEDENAMKPAPLAVGSGIWWGWVGCYQVQNAYFTRGGDSYLTAVGLGLAAYGLTVAATVLGIDSQNILATTFSSGLVNMVVSGGQNAAVQYFATGTVDKNELFTEVAKGGISGMIGGAVSYGLSEHWAGRFEWSNGERLYPESGAAAGFVGQAVSTGFSNIVEMKNPDTKTEPVEVEK